MNIVFFGSDNFAIASLKALLTTKHKIFCVVTQPDRKKGRGLPLVGTQIKALAQEHNLDIYQPQRINTSETQRRLKDLNPDLFVVIAYGQILSKEVLAIPKIFSINVHASLLPKYRGAAPINWALIHGEKTTGITVIKMVEKMDAGPIILQKELKILDDDTSITLEDKLSRLAASCLLETIELMEKNNYDLVSQNEVLTSMAPKLKKSDGYIGWGKSASDIYNLIRGCRDWPGAFTYYKGKLLKIYKAKITSGVSKPSSSLPGTIIKVSQEGIVVAAGREDLIIEELQIEGKRRINVKQFIAGYRISVGEKLENKK